MTVPRQRRYVAVPLWLWAALWLGALLGADGWTEAAGAALLLLVGVLVAYEERPVVRRSEGGLGPREDG